jgi:hypothetical protein
MMHPSQARITSTAEYLLLRRPIMRTAGAAGHLVQRYCQVQMTTTRSLYTLGLRLKNMVLIRWTCLKVMRTMGSSVFPYLPPVQQDMESGVILS